LQLLLPSVGAPSLDQRREHFVTNALKEITTEPVTQKNAPVDSGHGSVFLCDWLSPDLFKALVTKCSRLWSNDGAPTDGKSNCKTEYYDEENKRDCFRP